MGNAPTLTRTRGLVFLSSTFENEAGATVLDGESAPLPLIYPPVPKNATKRNKVRYDVWSRAVLPANRLPAAVSYFRTETTFLQNISDIQPVTKLCKVNGSCEIETKALRDVDKGLLP